MATVAELRMDVDSRPVKNAGRDLDVFSAKASKAERAAGKLGDGSRNGARGVADLAREAGQAGRNVGGMEAAIGRAIGRLAGFAAGVIGVVGALRGMAAGLQAADDFRALDNRIKLVTDSAEEFAHVQEGLIRISRDTFATIEGTVQAYQRMAGATDRLGISQDRLLGVAETVNKAVALSGATSQAAEASLIQFGQALSNNFQASSQEINSLNEQVFALSDAIARGITKVTGIETFRSDLKRMAEDGKLSSALVIRALEAVKDETDATFNGLDRTFAQVSQRLKTNAQVLAKEAFGPLLSVKIDFYSRIAKALEDPRTIRAAQKFGATLVDIAHGIERNADMIGKAFQGIAASVATLAGIGALTTLIKGIAGLRAAILALGVAAAANPLGLFVAGLTVAVGLVVTFRDQITRALTPFESFSELAAEVGPVLRGAFAIATDAAKALLAALDAIDARFRSLLPQAKESGKGLFSRISQIAEATTPFKKQRDAFFRMLAERGRQEEEEDRQRKLKADLAKSTDAARTFAGALTSVGKASSAANDNLGAMSQSVSKVASSMRAGVAEAERLFKAAQGGQTRFDAVTRQIDIEKTAAEAVAKAAEAGEKLSMQTALALETKRRDLLDAANALLEAEDALRDRAQAKSSEIAESIENQIVKAFRKSGNVDLGNLNPRELHDAALALERTFQEQMDFISSDATIGIDADTLLELQKKIKEAHEEGAESIRDAMYEGSNRFKSALENTFGAIFDDLLFNRGRGLGDLFRNALRDIGSSVFSKPLAKFLSGDGDLFGNFAKSFKDLIGNFAKAGKSVAASLSKSLAEGGQALGAALGGALAGFSVGSGLGDLLGLSKGSTGRRTLTGAATGAGLGAAVGSVVPGVGTALGAAVGAIAGAIGGALSGIFGRKTSTGVVEIASGAISGTKNSKKEGGARNERRDTILNSVSEIAKAFADALGATLIRGVQLQVDAGKKSIVTTLKDAAGNILGTAKSGKEDVEGAINAALKLVIDKAFSGGNQTLKDFANSALAAGRSIEEVIAVLQVLKEASATGVKALSDYALVAAKAGRSADQIVQGVQALSAVYDLTKPQLSEIAQQIKNIDDAINPVIADLKSLGQSFAEVARIGKDAGIALGRSFLDGIRELNIDLQNTVFGQFNKLLEEIRRREADAKLLLDKGFISQQQFGFVQSTSGLQVSKFFENLSDDDKASLADFLGLLRTASGDVAVARVKLEEQFQYLIDNVEETARGLEEAARNFERLSQNLKQTADSIRTEFGGLTPKANVESLSGRVTALLNEARKGNASAFEALPQVVNSLVQAARQAFGGTETFARIRDFGLSALDEAATLADTLARQKQAEADAARADVKLLTDIRELLNDDRQLPTLQKILDEGKLTNTLIAQQLQAFLNLMSTAGSNLNQITAQQLQQAAADYLARQQAQIAAQTPGPAPSSSSAPAASQGALTNEQIVQIIADNAAASSRLAASNANIANQVSDMATEVRRLVSRLAA